MLTSHFFKFLITTGQQMNTHLQKLNALLNHGCPKGYKPVEKNYENKFLFLIGTDKLSRTKVANA